MSTKPLPMAGYRSKYPKIIRKRGSIRTHDWEGLGRTRLPLCLCIGVYCRLSSIGLKIMGPESIVHHICGANSMATVCAINLKRVVSSFFPEKRMNTPSHRYTWSSWAMCLQGVSV